LYEIGLGLVSDWWCLNASCVGLGEVDRLSMLLLLLLLLLMFLFIFFCFLLLLEKKGKLVFIYVGVRAICSFQGLIKLTFHSDHTHQTLDEQLPLQKKVWLLTNDIVCTETQKQT
jgi:hypothetical protein